MRLKPRDYQDFAVKSLFAFFKNNPGLDHNPLVLAPTGVGKSIIIAMFVENALKMFPQTRIQVLTHVKELIEQNHAKLMSLWPNAPAGIYSAGLKQKDTQNNIIFGGIASVAKKAHLFGRVDLLIVDEAHLINPEQATMYLNYINQLKRTNPYLKVIGLTATGWRSGYGSLVQEGSIFTDVCVDMTTIEAFNWFIDQGYIVPLVSPRTDFVLDISGVTKRGDDFDKNKLQAAVTKVDVTRKALARMMDFAADRRSILIFASGVEHAQQIAQIMTDEFGIECEAVYTGMPGDRDDVVNRFKSGKLRAVVNNNILTTGFDHPGLDLIVCLRPTLSSVLWVQMLGRGTRPWFLNASDYDLETRDGRLSCIADSGKLNCLVLDFADNARRLGPINDPVKPHRKGDKPGPAPIKECPACNVQNHASVRFCGGKPAPHQNAGYCGAEFIFQVKIKEEAAKTELIKRNIEQEMPVIVEMRVETVQYDVLARAGRARMMQVSYQSGLNFFKELVCFEHPQGNYARTKAEQWWRTRSNSPVPKTVAEAIEYINEFDIARPTDIRVQTNMRYPTILASCFDGTAFGKLRTSVPSEETDDIQLNVGVTVDNLKEIPF